MFSFCKKTFPQTARKKVVDRKYQILCIVNVKTSGYRVRHLIMLYALSASLKSSRHYGKSTYACCVVGKFLTENYWARIFQNTSINLDHARKCPE